MLEGPGRRTLAEVNPLFADEVSLQAATQGERLAQELHDGVLQSMTAAALQLEVAWRLIETNPDAARARLRDVQQTIGQGQRELRAWTEKLQSAVASPTAAAGDLARALAALRQQVERRWGLRVLLTMDVRDPVSGDLFSGVYWIVQEALTNAGRHARATHARADIKLARRSDRIRIAVADDGCGFPFRGRFDLAQLSARGIGPRSLKERVASLNGDLVLSSELSGSRLEISVPLVEPRRGALAPTSADM
jgi:signal transduction histidine kinase